MDFFNEISLLYGTVQDYCSDATCPVMNAGSFEYLWSDGNSKPQKLSAPQYIDRLMVWIEDQLNNQSIFPTDVGTFKCSACCAFR